MEICVFGAASMTMNEDYTSAIENLGEVLAKRGHNLVFGSGSSGAMGAVAKGFRKGGGKTHGVIPTFFKNELSDFVDWNCDKMTYTETMRERKAIMEDEADCFIITPGGAGTFEEFFEVLTLKQLGQHKKPIAIFNLFGYYNSLNAAIENGIKADFIKPACRKLYKICENIDDIVDYIENDDAIINTADNFK